MALTLCAHQAKRVVYVWLGLKHALTVLGHVLRDTYGVPGVPCLPSGARAKRLILGRDVVTMIMHGSV